MDQVLHKSRTILYNTENTITINDGNHNETILNSKFCFYSTTAGSTSSSHYTIESFTLTLHAPWTTYLTRAQDLEYYGGMRVSF
jgi:hypothetical protein